MDELSSIAAQCVWSGRASLAKRLQECACALRGDVLVSCLKLASPKLPVCTELAAVWLALFYVAGIECSAQRAVDTGGADLRCTFRLESISSIFLVAGDTSAVDALACTIARFKNTMRLRELVVVTSDAAPYVVAERIRSIMCEASEVTTSAVRASFRVGYLSILVAREAESPFSFVACTASQRDACAFAIRGESLVCGTGASFPLMAYAPDRLLSDPSARVAMMDRPWNDSVCITVPADATELRSAVAECFACAGRLLGIVERAALIASVYASVRSKRAPHARDDWHDDLARAAARLAIAIVHNTAQFLDEASERTRVQPALAVLLEAAHSLSGLALLRAAFAALEGATMRTLSATCICTEIVPAPSNAEELLCVLFALYRVRMQTVRDAESCLGIGRAMHVEASVERSGELFSAELVVTRVR